MPKLRGVGMSGNRKPTTDYCPGCGLHRHVTGEHRPDCTAHPSALHCAGEGCAAVRAAGVRTPVWLYVNRRYYCPDHR